MRRGCVTFRFLNSAAALYFAAAVPVAIGFGLIAPVAVDVAAYVAIALHTVVAFYKGFEKDNVIHDEPALIFKNYITSYFALDSISLVPLDWLYYLGTSVRVHSALIGSISHVSFRLEAAPRRSSALVPAPPRGRNPNPSWTVSYGAIKLSMSYDFEC